MVATHATKAGVRYRYYVSTPFLHGEAKTASAGSVSRVPAADIEDTVARSLKEHLAAKQDGSTLSALPLGNPSSFAELIAGIVVHKDRLVVRFKSDQTDEASDRPDAQLLTIPWQKPPSKRSRRILLPHNASRSEVRPEQFERRARLVSAIARGRQWLDDVVSGRVTTVAELCAREKCSVRQVNMTISLAFLAPDLVKAVVKRRLVSCHPKFSRQERNFRMQRPEAKNPPERPLLSAETGNVENGRQESPRKGLFSIDDGFRSSGRLGGGRTRARTWDPLIKSPNNRQA
jgi:site-specific DNA recombinase